MEALPPRRGPLEGRELSANSGSSDGGPRLGRELAGERAARLAGPACARVLRAMASAWPPCLVAEAAPRARSAAPAAFRAAGEVEALETPSGGAPG